MESSSERPDEGQQIAAELARILNGAVERGVLTEDEQRALNVTACLAFAALAVPALVDMAFESLKIVTANHELTVPAPPMRGRTITSLVGRRRRRPRY